MKTHDIRCLRGEILKTLCYIPFEPVRVRGLLRALRPSGFPDLTDTSLMGELKYLEAKRYIAIERVRNTVTEEEVTVVTITASGKDVKEKTITDPGVTICE